MNSKELAGEIHGALTGFVERAIAGVAERIAKVEGDYLAMEKLIGESVAGLEAKMAAIPAGPRGEDGIAGADGKDGADGSNGNDGAPGKDGADGMVGKDGAPGRDGDAGRDGRDGVPGKDALQIDIVESLDNERRYQRGTFAKHRGGIIRAFRQTDPMTDSLETAGWSVVVDGIAEVVIQQAEDMRTFGFAIRRTSGIDEITTFAVPAMIDRGVYREGTQYLRGDSATWDGSIWTAQVDVEAAADRPLAPEWRLAVKRGRDGKDAKPIAAVGEPLRLR